jgi:hypothetical protein
MPIIDYGDPSTWPVGWEPEFVTEARELGRAHRREGLTTSHSPYTKGTLSASAYLSGWDIESIAIARRNGWTFNP